MCSRASHLLRNEPRTATGSVNLWLGSCALYHRGVQPHLAVATPNLKNTLCHSSPVACSVRDHARD